jgi:hypothetical protein
VVPSPETWRRARAPAVRGKANSRRLCKPAGIRALSRETCSSVPSKCRKMRQACPGLKPSRSSHAAKSSTERSGRERGMAGGIWVTWNDVCLTMLGTDEGIDGAMPSKAVR